MNKTYSTEEALKTSLDFFNGDDLAADVFVSKYALRDKDNNLLEKSPEDMHKRLAREFARIEQKYKCPLSEKEIFDLLKDWTIVPQGSPMSSIGNTHQVQSLSNCFVVESPEDSYGGIMLTDQEQAQIMKRRGGVGFDISTIRPKGMKTSNAAKTTDGIGVFMERFSNTCREVAQGGRRGALMLSLSVHHPEVRTFINIKKDLSKVTGANISLRLTDEFMQAVSCGENVQLRFPIDKNVEHSVSEFVDAKQLWDEIIEAAWLSAEPGLLFWDTVINRSPADAYAELGFKTISTNPCGELPLSAYDSCRLTLVNLNNFVCNRFTEQAFFDTDRFASVVQKAQRLMDDIVDLENEKVDTIINKLQSDPERIQTKAIEIELWKKIKQNLLNGRRTGLGITGLGDMLAGLNITYGSDEAIKMTDQVYQLLAINAWYSSVVLASERGAFPIFDSKLEVNHSFINDILDAGDSIGLRELHQKYGRRNIALLTTAPAGSVSILTQTTSGCEPVFMLSYKRRKKINPNNDQTRIDFVDQLGDKWQEFTVYHHGYKQWIDQFGEDNVDKSPYANATSADINWVKKIDMQAAAQKWICHAISNTCNLPTTVTKEDVAAVYMRGWSSNCKGVTIYRDGSRSGVLVSEETQNDIKQPGDIQETHAPKRPKKLRCDVHRANIKGESYLILVGLLNDKPYELFCGLSQHIEVPKKFKTGDIIKNGKKAGVSTYNLSIPLSETDDDVLMFKDIVNLFDNPLYGSLTRTISLALRHGVPVSYLVEQLRKDKTSDVTSFSNVIARVLSKAYVVDGTAVQSEKKCDSCGSNNLSYQQGCVTCINCGNSKCS